MSDNKTPGYLFPLVNYFDTDFFLCKDTNVRYPVVSNDGRYFEGPIKADILMGIEQYNKSIDFYELEGNRPHSPFRGEPKEQIPIISAKINLNSYLEMMFGKRLSEDVYRELYGKNVCVIATGGSYEENGGGLWCSYNYGERIPIDKLLDEIHSEYDTIILAVPNSPNKGFSPCPDFSNIFEFARENEKTIIYPVGSLPRYSDDGTKFSVILKDGNPEIVQF